MKKSILSLFFAVAFVIPSFCAESYYSYKVKFVMKDKTSFVAYLYNSGYDFNGEDTYEKSCTDKGFQAYLNKKNYYYTNSKNGTIIKNKGVMLYKNSYSIKISDPDLRASFSFCTPTDEIIIDANAILYTVYLGKAPAGEPTLFDSTSVQDLRNNKIKATHINSFEICNYYFFTTDKRMTSNKIKSILKRKKIILEKLIEMGDYHKKVKSELAKLKIYLFQECSC